MAPAFTFHIIYTPGTVDVLRRFVPSLLEWTSCRFRLVGNGCPDREADRLRQYAETSDRLEFYRYPSSTMDPHGVVLTHLHDRATEDHFCFMDSDIFAVGDFAAELTPHLEGNAAFFSGAPIWLLDSDRTAGHDVGFCGPHNSAESGVSVGSSYFAVYSNAALTELRRATGITFAKVTSLADLPQAVHAELEQAGCLRKYYEAGKAINALLQTRGHTIAYAELENLRHVGGLSLLAKKRRLGRAYVTVQGDEATFPSDYDPKVRPWIPRKRLTCYWISGHLAAVLSGSRHGDPLLVQEDAVRKRVFETAKRLEQMHRQTARFFAELDAAHAPSLWTRVWRGLKRLLGGERGL